MPTPDCSVPPATDVPTPGLTVPTATDALTPTSSVPTAVLIPEPSALNPVFSPVTIRPFQKAGQRKSVVKGRKKQLALSSQTHQTNWQLKKKKRKERQKNASKKVLQF